MVNESKILFELLTISVQPELNLQNETVHCRISERGMDQYFIGFQLITMRPL